MLLLLLLLPSSYKYTVVMLNSLSVSKYQQSRS